MLIAKIKDSNYNYEVRKKSNEIEVIRFAGTNISLLNKKEVLNLFKNIVDDLDMNILDYFDKYGTYATLFDDENEMSEEVEEQDEVKEITTSKFQIISNRIFIIILVVMLALVGFTEYESHKLEKELAALQEQLMIVEQETREKEEELKFLQSIAEQASVASPNDFYELIVQNEHLSNFAKSLISNPQLIEDIVEFKDENSRTTLYYNLTRLQIVPYTEDENTYAIGYVDPLERYKIHLEDTSNKTVSLTLPHEYVHVLQEISSYPFLLEATAEMISNEYFDTEIKTYVSHVTALRTLMEIIGPEPIWQLSFGGNATLLEESIKTYLNEEDSKTLLDIFKLSPVYENEEITAKTGELNNLLSKMYTAKYGTPIEDDEIIDTIRHSSRVYRYYFNAEKIKENEEINGFCAVNLYVITDKTKAKFYINRNNTWVEIPFQEYVDSYKNGTEEKDLKVECLEDIEGFEIDGTTWAITFDGIYPCIIAKRYIPCQSITQKFTQEYNVLKK